ncbi:HNH endonuclease, partial [Cupriavidus necator]
AIRATGSFNIQTAAGVVQGISYKHCRVIQRGDGFAYSTSTVAPTTKESESRGDASRRALSLPGLKAEVSRANG